MNNTIYQNISSQLSVLIVNLIFFLYVIQPHRFSRKATALASIAGFSFISLPRVFFPELFAAGTAATFRGLTFHFIYWLISITIPYALFFLLLKRDWLRNMLLYVIWDITVTLLFLLSVIFIRIFLPQMYMQVNGSLLCIVAGSTLSAFILRLPLFQTLRLPGKFCAAIIVIYSVGRLANTLFLLRFEEKFMQKMVICSVIFLIIFLSLAIMSARFFVNTYISRKCRDMENTFHTGSLKTSGGLNLMMQRIGALCQEQNIQFEFHFTAALAPSGLNGIILYIIQLLLVLSQTLDGRTSGKILFTIQEHNGFLLLSSCSTCPLGCQNRILILFTLLQNSVLEILFNRAVQICHGYIQYLDSSPSGKQIRVAIPFSGK